MSGFDHGLEHIDEDMLLIQANIDDMNPEWTTPVSERLFELGANDVFWIPIIMKKGRPGMMLNVLLHRDLQSAVEETIFRETTTLGIRYIKASCHRLGRQFETVETPWGAVKVKVGYMQEEIVQFAPEFKECEQIAKQYGIPLKQVYAEVNAAFMRQQKKN